MCTRSLHTLLDNVVHVHSIHMVRVANGIEPEGVSDPLFQVLVALTKPNAVCIHVLQHYLTASQPTESTLQQVPSV